MFYLSVHSLFQPNAWFRSQGAQKVYVSFIEPLLEKAFTDENVAAAEKLAQDIQNGVKRKVVTDFNETA